MVTPGFKSLFNVFRHPLSSHVIFYAAHILCFLLDSTDVSVKEN
jgi:hypothetical protein